MASVWRIILLLTVGSLLSGCAAGAAATTVPTLAPTETLAPAAEVTRTRPTATLVIPPDMNLTEQPAPLTTAGALMFQFDTPKGFYLQDKPNGLIMENKEKNIRISLEQLDHQGKTSAMGFLNGFAQESIYNMVGSTESYAVAGRPGWIANVEAPGVYENGTGQIVVADIDADRLFYAVGLAKGDVWEASGKSIFKAVIDSVTFPGTQ